MSIRENIAANLRELCGERGSIAQVCREVGINRQQFSRYLTGDAVPNKTNLAKICRFFGVDEDDLIQNPTDLRGEPGAQSLPPQVMARWSRIFDNLISSPLPSLPDGAYFLHYGFNEEGAEIARSAMFIRTDGPLKTFRRITNISTVKPGTMHFYHGDHTGIVLERRHWFYLVGMAADGREEPSLVTVQWMGVTPPLLSGTAMVVGISDPMVLPVIIEPLPDTRNVRETLAGCGMYSQDTPEIAQIIKSSLQVQRRKMQQM